MVTKVGKQSDFANALKELVELDFDAIEAYETAIYRLENSAYKTILARFKHDHERHVQELSEMLKKHGEDAPKGPSLKKWLAKGKVVLANLSGDNLILVAMLSNEVDTNTAYETMNKREDKWPDSIEILERGWEDEKRHKEWLDAVAA